MATSASPTRVRFDLESSPLPREQQQHQPQVQFGGDGSPLPVPAGASPARHANNNNNDPQHPQQACSPSPAVTRPPLLNQQFILLDQLQQQSALDEHWGLLFRALCDEHGVITEGSVHARLSMLLPALDWALPMHDSGVLFPPPATATAAAAAHTKSKQRHGKKEASAVPAAADADEHADAGSALRHRRRSHAASTTGAAVSVPPSASPARNHKAGSAVSAASHHQHQQHHHAVQRLLDGGVVKAAVFRRLLRQYLPVLGHNTPLPIGVVDAGGFTDPAVHLDVFSGFVASAAVSKMRVALAGISAAEILQQHEQEQKQQHQNDDADAAVDPAALYSALLSLPLSVTTFDKWHAMRDALLQSCSDVAGNSAARSELLQRLQKRLENGRQHAPREFRPFSMPILTAFGEPSDEDECTRILLLVLLRNAKSLRHILQRFEAPSRQLARVLIASRMSFAVGGSSGGGATQQQQNAELVRSVSRRPAGASLPDAELAPSSTTTAPAAVSVAASAAHEFAQELCRWTLHLWTGARGVLDTPLMQRIGERYMVRKAKEFQKLAKRFRRFFVELEEQDECDVLRAGRANSPGQLVQKAPETPAAVVLQAAPTAARSVSPAAGAAAAAGSPLFSMSRNNNNSSNNNVLINAGRSVSAAAATAAVAVGGASATFFSQIADGQANGQDPRDAALDQLSRNPALWLKQVENSMEPPPLSLLHHMLPEDRREIASARKWATVRAFVVGFIAALLIAGSDVLASMILFGPDASLSTKLGIGADFVGSGAGGIDAILQFLGPASPPSSTTTTTTTISPATTTTGAAATAFNSSGAGPLLNGSSTALGNGTSSADNKVLLGTAEAIAYWIIVLTATCLVSVGEILYLYIDALNTCYDCAVVVGIVLRHRTEDGKRGSWRDVLKQQLSAADAATAADENDDDDEGDDADGEEDADEDDVEEQPAHDNASAADAKKKKANNKSQDASGFDEDDFAEELVEIFVPDAASPIGSPSRLRFGNNNNSNHNASISQAQYFLNTTTGDVSPGRTARVAKTHLRSAVVASLKAAARVREVVCRKRCKFIDGAISRCALSLGHGTITLFGIDLNRTRDGWARTLKSLFKLIRTPLSVVIVQLLLGRLVWKLFIPFVSAPVCAMWNAVIVWGAITEMHGTVVAAVGAERLVLEVAQRCKDLHLGSGSATAAAAAPANVSNTAAMNGTILLPGTAAAGASAAASQQQLDATTVNGAILVAPHQQQQTATPDTVEPDYAVPHHVLQLWARCAFSVGAVEALSTPSFHIVVAGLLQRLGSVVPMRAQHQHQQQQQHGQQSMRVLDDEVLRLVSSLSNEQEVARLDLTNARLFFVALSGAVNRSSEAASDGGDSSREYARGVTTSVVAMQLALLLVLGKMDSVCHDAKSRYRKLLCATIACYAAPKIAFAAAGAAAQLSGGGTATNTADEVVTRFGVDGESGGDGGDNRQRSISRMLFLEKELQQHRQQQTRRQAAASRLPSQQIRQASELQEASANGNLRPSHHSGGGGANCCWCCWCVDTSCCNEVGEFSNADIHAAFIHKITDRAKAITEHVSAFLFGNALEKTIMWAELTAEKDNLASVLASSSSTATGARKAPTAFAKPDKLTQKQQQQQQQAAMTSSTTTAPALATAANSTSSVPAVIVAEEQQRHRKYFAGEPVSASPSPLKDRGLSSSPLVVGRIVPAAVPSAAAAAAASASASPSPLAKSFVSPPAETPAELLLSNQLVPRRSALRSSSASPSQQQQQKGDRGDLMLLSASISSATFNDSFRRPALRSQSNSKRRAASAAAAAASAPRADGADSEDDDVMAALDDFFHIGRERSARAAKPRSQSSSPLRGRQPSNNKNNGGNADNNNLLVQQTMPMFERSSRSNSRGGKAARPSASSSSSNDEEFNATEHIQQQEAVRLLMFEAGATSKSRSASKAAAAGAGAAAGSTTRQNSTTRRNSAASAAAAAAVDDAEKRRVSTSALSSSGSSDKLLGNCPVVDHRKKLLKINETLMQMQRKFSAGAPMSGALLVDIAASMVDLVSMWHYNGA